MTTKTNFISSPVRIFALGGLGEVGKNTYIVEDDDTLVIIDAGVLFPEQGFLGIDYVIPDYSYLKANSSKIKALFITHGHEDHIGAIPFLLQNVNIPVIYAPRLAAALIKNKLEEHRQSTRVKIVEYNEDSLISVGSFSFSFFRVTHSIPDSYGISVDTPQGRIVTTGDFKIDLTPIGPDISLSKITRLGDEGIDLLLSDSTNAEKEGYTPSESSVAGAIDEIFKITSQRLIISTFSSNVSRLSQITDSCIKYKRKILVIGRSMETAFKISRDYGYIKAPDSQFITADQLKDYKNSEIAIICTGSQGEPMAALSRIASGTHNLIKIIPGDTIVFSSSAIPGNTISILKVCNDLQKCGANVITNSVFTNLHASGHPSKHELRLMLKLARPKYFMPVHGELHMLKIHGLIAEQIGIPKDNIFICGNGDVLELFHHEVTRSSRRVEADNIYIDGKDVTGLSTAVILDRNILADDGMVAALIAIDSRSNEVLALPEIITKGFVYPDEKSIAMINESKVILKDAISEIMKRKTTFGEIKNVAKSVLSSYYFKHTHRNPMIIPLIMNKLEEK